MIDALTYFKEWIVGLTGSTELSALLIIIFFLGILLLIGIEFRWSVLIVSPLAVAFSFSSWVNIWVSTVFWLLVAGLGLFMIYKAYEGY